MRIVDRLGDGLLWLALHVAPRSRRDTALAMWAEFRHCEHNRLGWALGGLGAALRWRIGVDWLYALLLIAAPFLMPFLGLMLFEAFFGDRNVPVDAFHHYQLVQSIFLGGAAFIGAALLSGYRPGNWAFTGLVGVAVSFLLLGSWTLSWGLMGAAWILGAALGPAAARTLAR